MGIFDGIISQVSGHPDVSNLAGKLGLDPAVAEKAIAALGIAHQQDGDTAQLASERSGLDVGTVQQIIQQIGGEGSLGQFASALAADPGKVASLFDKDGDGSVMDDLTGMAKGLFGKS
ncbi:hypothetical protein [Novosphingobium sp. Leaf2]|uniref:hypothetical protein n=1 Tax=Novosphingobium sp. Leaf2 TaxID=1735670 RepID=UPI0006F3E5D0|nr:hypothetical protein [Novosphingobium sp. Leaf2]KQM17358.1 hypothetical protein ASE49_09840 [Novosphingobium sp. Leaf2]